VVTEIASSAKISGEGSVDQKTDFEVEITIISPGDELRPGMTASSDVITDIAEDVLAVPIQSVTVRTPAQLKKVESVPENGDVAIADDSAGLTYTPDKDGFVEVVFVVQGETVAARQVKTGIQSETHIQIREGISEGDEIVIGNYRAISQDLRNGSPITIEKAMARR
jgi:HlyD family secretion protein